MEYTQIKYEVSDLILTITLDRPDRLNAFTPMMRAELIDALERADADDNVRVVIVTGAGRAFCAGADMSRGADTFDYASLQSREMSDTHKGGGGLVTLKIHAMKKPVIAAINGPAVGFGASLILPMDIRLAATTATIGFVFARRGVVLEACSSWFLPRIVGISRAAEWVLSGRIFDAQEALASGLVIETVSPDALVARAYAIASEIARNTSAVSIALCRQLLWRMLGENDPVVAHDLESKCMVWAGPQPDAREGVLAFLNKRPPIFTMKASSDMPDFYPWW